MRLINRGHTERLLRQKEREHGLLEGGAASQDCFRFLNSATVSHFTNMIEKLVGVSRTRSSMNYLSTKYSKLG